MNQYNAVSKLRVVILLLVLFSTSLSVVAQEYNFINYTVDNGLPVTQILAVNQMPDGRIIIGTQNGGFTIYDGNSFSTYNEEMGLANNIVFDLIPFKGEKIVCGTNRGLSVFQYGTFTNFTSEDGLSHDRIYCLTRKGDELYMGTGQGVSRFNGHTVSKVSFGNELDSVDVLNIVKLSNGRLLYCTGGKGVFLETGDHKYKHLDLPDDYNYAFSAVELKDSAIWILGYDGIASYANGVLKELRLPGISTRAFTDGIVDRDGILWLATEGSLIRIEDGKLEELTTFNGLVNNQIWKVFEDKENNLWFVSRQNGISKLSDQSFVHYPYYEGVENQPYLNSEAVLSVFIDSSQNVWLGQETGYTQVVNRVFHPKRVKVGWAGQEQFMIEHLRFNQLPNGQIIAGTDNGISFPEKNAVTLEGYVRNKSTNVNYIYAILVDNQKQIWLGTRGGAAMFKDGKVESIMDIIPTDKDVFDIDQDHDGNILFATDVGLFQYDGKTTTHFTKKDGLVSGRIKSITASDDGTIWLATNDGLFKKEGNKFTNYTTEDGLSSNAINSMIFDDSGNLWAGLSNGIDKIVLENGLIASVDHCGPDAGFTGKQCMMNAIDKDNNGHLWIGTVAGVTEFKPRFYHRNTELPTIQIGSVNLFGQPTDWNVFADSVSLKNIPVDLELPYHQNYLTFNFIGISMVAPEKVRYKYMLEGVDKHWSSVTPSNEAVYTNLEAGTYTFKVIACNNEGLWNNDPSTFTFTINPPFWRTWWFYGICMLIFASGVYSYLKIRAANIKILEANEKIVTQATIIEEKNKDITDSIEYAKRLQEAFLPSPEEIRNSYKDAFVLFKPKDIVSGDFFWFNKSNNTNVLIAADCTGHGVPGAMMSMVGNNLLNQIVSDGQITNPSEILHDLDIKLVKSLMGSGEGKAQDGMDIAICTYDPDSNTMLYAGANNPLYVIRQSSEPLMVNGEAVAPRIDEEAIKLYEVKATRQPIGSFDEKIPFELNKVDMQPGDACYIFSDGYADQFGGPRGKKFRYRQFRELLLHNYDKPMSEQSKILDQSILEWQGGMEQIDDICVIGIKV